MNRLNGIKILTMYQNNEFKKGDILIAFQEDSTGNELSTVYRYVENSNKSTSFVDIENKCELDAFDLKYCEFIIIEPKRNNYIPAYDIVTESLLKNCTDGIIVIEKINNQGDFNVNR